MFQSFWGSRRGNDVQYLVSWLRGHPTDPLLWCSGALPALTDSYVPVPTAVMDGLILAACVAWMTSQGKLWCFFFFSCYAHKAKKGIKVRLLLTHGMERQVLSPQGRTFEAYGQSASKDLLFSFQMILYVRCICWERVPYGPSSCSRVLGSCKGHISCSWVFRADED